MAAELLRSGLPYSWTYGVTADGRIFFIDDENRRTTWLHPRDREPVQTGYRPLRDLPQGWEQGVTPEGALYYVDHNTHSTTFVHPITKETVAADVNLGSNEAPSLQRPADKSIAHSPQSPYHPEESPSPSSPMDSKRNTLKKSPSGKTRIVDRHPSVKGNRNNKAAITMRGWLLKQDHTGPLRNWKQRWCVLADFCLFFYKDNTETQAIGSILLPSYKVNTCDKDDGINKKFAFKVEHENMQTYFFSADTRDDMQKWLNALSLATILQRDPSVDQGPPRLPNGPTADKFINHPAKQVDENDNSVISGNDLDDYGFPERYPQRRTMQEGPTRSDGYPDRGRGNPNAGYGRDSGAFDANRDDDYRYNAGYDDRARYDPEGQGYSYQGDPNMRDSYSERVPYRRQDSDVSNQRGRDSYSDRGDVYEPGSELRSKGHGDPSYGGPRLGGPQASGPSHDSYGNRTANIPDRTFEPIAGTSQPKGYGSLNRSPQRPEQNPHYDVKRPGDRDSYMDYRDPRWPDSEGVPLREPHVPKYKQGYDDRGYNGGGGASNGQDRGYDSRLQYNDRGPGTVGQTLKVPSMQLRITDQGDNQRQSLVGDGDGSDSVFTDRSDQKKIVPTKAETVQSLQRWHQNESGRQDLGPRRPDSQAQSYDGARYDTDRQYRRDSDIGAYNPQNLSQESREPDRGSGYDPRGNREINGRKPQNPSNQNAVQTSPKRHHDLSLDARSDHIYENISPYEAGGHNASDESVTTPNRPPLPVVYRDQIIRELAQTQTPHTQQDFIDAAENESKRYHQPTYFQFPESPPSGQKDAPDSNYEAKQMVENLEGRPYEPDDASIQGQRQNNGRNDNADKRIPPPKKKGKKGSQSSQRSTDYPHPQRSNDNPQSFTNPPSFTNDGGRYDSLGRGAKPQFRPAGEPIQTIKEDPNMADTDVFETKYRSLRKTYSVTPLNGHKLRLSIQPGDLEGKSHEELVLLLIQLRREQSKLERNRDTYRKLVEQRREKERNYKSLWKSGARTDDVMDDEHEQFKQIKLKLENLENHVEVHRPLVNLVDNMVKMGSLYTGSTDMLFSQYKKHLLSPDEVTPPKRMLEFSRQLQEDKLVNDHKEDLKNLKQEDIDYEEKMVQLHQLDRELQELSIMVTSLQDDKKMLDQAMREVERDQDRYKDDPREMERLTQEHRVLERQLSNCVHQLAEHSRVLEEVTAENSKVEMEVTLLRSKVHDISKSSSMPTLSSESYRTKVKLENELNKVQDIMDGLSKQGQELSDAMNTLRKSNPDLTASGSTSDRPGTYFETDLDNMKSRDIALRTPTPTTGIRRSYSERDSYSARGSRDDLHRSDTEDQDMTDADDNTKRYYGFLPKDKKATTVRDVKRESERRSRGRDPSPRFSGSPLNRTQSLPRHLDGRVEQETIQQQQMSPNYSSPPTSAFDRNGPGSTQALPTRGSQGTGNLSSQPLSSQPSSSPFAPNMPGSTSTLPTRGSQNPSDPDVLRQTAAALSRQQSLTRLPQPMQRKQMSASYDALDQQISPKIQKPMSASHEILNRPEIPERRYEPIRTVSTSDIQPRLSQENIDFAQHRNPDASRRAYPDVTRQQYSKQTDPYPDVGKQPEYRDVAKQPGYPDVSRQPENVPHVPPRYPDAARPSGYHGDSQPKPGYPKDVRQPIKSKPWEPKLSGNNASLSYSPPDATRNGHPYEPASEPISQAHPVGYGSVDRKANGYGSLDRHPQRQQVPRSPETDIKRPFDPIEPEQASYQQSARPLEPPRGQYEDSALSDRYREPPRTSKRNEEPVRPGYLESKSKQYPDVIDRSPSPKSFQKYPSAHEHTPHGSRTDSPRAYPLGAPRDQQANRQEDRYPQEDKPKEYGQPPRGNGQPQFGVSQKPDSFTPHQPGSQQYERYRPRDQVEPPYHEERRHSPSTNLYRQVSVNNSSSSGRESVPDSAQLRRSATLPVGRASNKKNEWSPTVTDRLFPRNRDSTTSQSPRSSAHGTPQRMHSPLNHGRQSSPRSSAQNSRPNQVHLPYSRSDEPIQKQTSLPYSRTGEPIQQKQSKLPYSQSEEPVRPSKVAPNLRVPDEPKRDTRGRYQTIASSVPAQMEYSVEESEPEQNGKSNDDDMDDAEMFRRAKKSGRQYSFDDSTIDRLVLFSPDKVDIPERYVPDDEEELSPEELDRRERKVERIRKLLSAQSLQDWTKVGVEDNTRSLHDTVSDEKKRREVVLEMREKLARQVTLRSKQVAAEANKKQRRKTWSGGNARSWEDVVG
ncbi:uncharacterized protein LOC135492690 isoform X2 [Lineus longissimus]|uniref:uncharacterized protein LOC135492690 isoform X2 n=1 Tax=Lineus longissimus TaxID=88925 RepID=UPI00315D47E6